MYVTRYTKFSDLTPVRDDWERLAADNPFLSWDWCQSWWRNFHEQRSDTELFVAVVREELIKDENGHDTVLAIAPWQLEKSSTKGRRVKFLGSGMACADYLRLMSRPNYSQQACQALATWMTNANDPDKSSNFERPLGLPQL